MDKIKKHSVIVIVILALLVIVITSFAVAGYRKNYSLADFGISPLLKPDCSSVKNTNNNSPVTISLNAPNVSVMRDKIKLLIIKYNGQITSDSFNSFPTINTPTSYPSVIPNASSQDTANIIATFNKSQNDFLTELSGVVTSSGGVNTGYSYTDNSQPQYGNVYSSYTSCINMMQSVSADILQLEIFTKALKDDSNVADISLLSQSISTVKSTLQNDVNNINNFFATSDEPSVSISINNLQK